MSTHRHEFSIQGMCQALAVAGRGSYAWCAGSGQNQAARKDALLTEQMRRVFEQSGQTYGSPRVYGELKAQGIGGRRHRVARLMRQAANNARAPRHRVRTTIPSGQVHWVFNLLDRDFTADALNQTGLVDITAIDTHEGSLYLAGVLDLCSRRLVGWAMDEHMPDELTQDALEMAILQPRPPAQLLHHADQGSQQASHAYQALLARPHLLASSSGVGCCYDYAPLERSWVSLKTERVYRHHYHTRAEPKNAMSAYIEGGYNRQRRHSTLG